MKRHLFAIGILIYSISLHPQLHSSARNQIKEDVIALKNNNPKFNNTLNKLLRKNHFLKGQHARQPIPKILHFIWLGPKSMPEVSRRCIESWKRKHPKWKIYLWTDKDLDSLNLRLRKQMDKCKNFGMKSDILRYELLYKFGGVYADVDFLCIKPFDPLVECNSFFAGNFTSHAILNGLMGCTPKHPIVTDLCNKLQNKRLDPDASPDQIQEQTGPFFLTRSILEKAERLNEVDNLAIYPPHYFYPNGHEIVRTPNKQSFDEKEIKQRWALKESFVVHLFNSSWIVYP